MAKKKQRESDLALRRRALEEAVALLLTMPLDERRALGLWPEGKVISLPQKD